MGRNEQGLKYLKEALAILKDVGDPNGEAMAFNNLGMLYMSIGEEKQALKCYVEALSICIKVGDRAGEGWALHNLGRVYVNLGRQEEALDYYKQALLIRKEVRESGGEGETLYDIGKLFFEEKHYDLALASLLLAKSIFEEVQSPLSDEVHGWTEKMHQEIGNEQFAALLAQVEPQASEIVEKALGREL